MRHQLLMTLVIFALLAACTPTALPASTPTAATATHIPVDRPTPTGAPIGATVTVAPATTIPAASPATATAIPLQPTPTGAAPAPHGDGPCTYRAEFVGDVTIPDNALLSPGASFVKTWRVRNDSTCTWGPAGYALHALVLSGGDPLGAISPVALPGDVPPGMTADLPVNMIVPANPGTYRSEWMFAIDGDPAGSRLLGVGPASAPLYAQIVVPPAGASDQSTIYTSSAYHYQVSYPTGWSLQVNTQVAPGAGSNPEYVTLTAPSGYLPRVLIEALTGAPPMTGFENCVRNFVFHNLPACKSSLAAGQNPAADIWVFQRGPAHFYIQLQYRDAASAQVFDDLMTSFHFTE